jgi:uncharacterized protein
MKFYLDTSLLVAALCSESKADVAYRWLAAQPIGSFAISVWSQPEFASALAIKVRTGQIGLPAVAAIKPVWDEMQRDMLTMLALEDADFSRAANMIATSIVPLRSGDALHLAVVERTSLALASFDLRMLAAAESFGMATVLP